MRKDIVHKIEHEIDDEVTDRFGRNGIICGYYVGRTGLRYEIEDEKGSWYEFPQYTNKREFIGIKEK